MTRARKSRGSTKSKSRGQGAKAARDPKASAKQLRYIEHLRDEIDPLSSGSELPGSKEAAGAEIARLLNLKRKYEAATRPPPDTRPKAAGQYRYPSKQR